MARQVPVVADLDQVEPLNQAELTRAIRLGWKEAWVDTEGNLRVTRSGSGVVRFYLFPGNKFLPGVIDRNDDDTVPVVRPLVFEGVTFAPVDARFIEVRSGSEVQVVAADRWCRRVASRIPRTIKAIVGQPVSLPGSVALDAAREVRVREK